VKPALLGFGTVVGNCIELFSLVGGVVSFGGIALVAASMLHAPGVPLWLGTLGMVASVIILVSRTGTFIGGSGGPLGKLGLLGFVAFMVWVVTTGFFMLSFPA
jgi:cbb3-type cytochrome oxidase subunit 1